MAEVSTVAQQRVRQLESTAAHAEHRAAELLRELQSTVPKDSFDRLAAQLRELNKRHAALFDARLAEASSESDLLAARASVTKYQEQADAIGRDLAERNQVRRDHLCGL